MSRLSMPTMLMLLVVGIMLFVNLISIPRGPMLSCYRNVTTYHHRQANYGFPFVFMRGNPTTDDCDFVSGNLAVENDYAFRSYNNYSFERQALILDAGVTILLAGAAYYVGSEIRNKKAPPHTTRKVSAKRSKSSKVARRKI